MNRRTRFAAIVFFASAVATLNAASLETLHKSCSMGPSEDVGRFSFRLDDGGCGDRHHCGSNFDDDAMSRFTGVTLADFGREGAHLTATLAAEAGTVTCTGTVRDQMLEGDATFTPDSAFVARMAQMGFSGLDSDKLLVYALLDVESAWAKSMQQTGITGITNDNLLALRIFKADPAYVKSIVDMGYKIPSADQLVGLKVQGVNAEEVREIRSLGYQPSLDELVQIRIFKITPDFIRRMQDRGFKNLSIAKLVQIRIFKLAD